MLIECFCGRNRLDPETTTYVRDGKPLCHEQTCHAVGNARREEMRRIESRRPITRIVEGPDGHFDVVG